MIPIVLEERNQQLSRQHPAASQNAAQPPSACRPHAKIATSLRGVAKAPLGEVSGAAELPPFKVFHSKTIDHWLTTRGLWFCGAHPFAPSAAVALPLTRLLSPCLASVFFLARPRLLSRAQSATSLGGVAEAPFGAVSGAADMLPSKVRRCTVHKTRCGLFVDVDSERTHLRLGPTTTGRHLPIVDGKGTVLCVGCHLLLAFTRCAILSFLSLTFDEKCLSPAPNMAEAQAVVRGGLVVFLILVLVHVTVVVAVAAGGALRG